MGLGAWIVGGFMGLLALAGLFLAATAHGTSFYWVGLALFAFGCGSVFLLIKQGFDSRK